MEIIIGFIANTQKPKFLGILSTTYSIIVTNKRTIFAKIDSKLLKEAMKKVIEKAKEENKGYFAKIKMQMEAMKSYPKKYMKMTPAEILAETPDNFVIDHNQVKKIKVNYSYREVDKGDGEFQPETLTSIKYKTNEKSFKFKSSEDLRKDFEKLYEGLVPLA